MTRWLWVWFFLLLGFPVMKPAMLRPAKASTTAPLAAVAASAPAPAVAWGGPLAEVIDRLAWVDGHASSAAGLRGKVVLVEFWAFECVNCRRTLPAMHALANRYHDSDVRIVAIHTPELPRERDPANATRAVAEAGIDYPVALDAKGEAWNAFENRYWPCLYVLDGAGRVRYRHIGELHQGTPGWDDLVRRIDLVGAAAKPAGTKTG